MTKEDIDTFVEKHLDNCEQKPSGPRDRYMPFRRRDSGGSGWIKLKLRSGETLVGNQLSLRTESALVLDIEETPEKNTIQRRTWCVPYDEIEYLHVEVTTTWKVGNP